MRTADDTPLAGVWLELRPAGDIDPIFGTDTRYVLAGTYWRRADSRYRPTRMVSMNSPVSRRRCSTRGGRFSRANLIDNIDTPGTLGGLCAI